MKPNIQQAWKICFTIVGTNIGAGFASGREIWEFFGSYGLQSTAYLLFSMALFALSSMIILWVSWKEQTDHYYSLLKVVMGERAAKYFDGLILLYLIASSLVMYAGSGATFTQWNWSYLLGSSLLAIAVWTILFFDVQGILSLNVMVMPILTVILCIVCLVFLRQHTEQPDPGAANLPWLPVWPSAVTYTALNVIPLMAVLATFGKKIQHPLEIAIAGGGSALCLGAVGVMLNAALLRIEHLIPLYDIPLFALIESYSPLWIGIVSLILWLAIYTTAVSNVYGAVFRIKSWTTAPPWLLALMLSVGMIPLAQFGFAKLLGVIYPLYGVVNMIVLAMIMFYPLTRIR
ncbi:YkvI family membrane protein [Numidum massiliense]|uniref:YkvI family membrane protein n=1 Tax=Numidum massiliense TaxID=1522315 RepID=UPI0006D5650E|nr:hypothetical protein [Numidum massiliense]